MTPSIAVEIAVQDVEGVRIALREEANRVELCSALAVGGLTPSIGLVEAAVGAAKDFGVEGFVHVLVRPRPGGFVYNAEEIDVIARDIRQLQDAGASGIVIGALEETGNIAFDVVAKLVDIAGPLDVTFHRAIDAAHAPTVAVDSLVEIGVARILTSGQAAKSIDGVAMLRQMAQRSAGRIQVMAGGGVGVGDIPTIADTGVNSVHLSARRSTTGTASGPGGGDASYEVTDAAIVRSAVEAAKSWSARNDQ